jgi:regulator of protease activity HflC (stomatin/prohibitin superfamily)
VILGVAAAVGVTRGFKIVQQGDVALVERLGKYQSRLNPGFHVIIPLVDRVRTTITQREQVFDIPPQECITSDNAPLSADAVVYWRVVDPEKATYSVVNLEIAIQNLVLTQIRSEIGKLTLDETFSAREKINSILLKDLDIATDPWGVKISRVEVRDIVPNREIMQAMEMQMAAERTKRAVIIKSEGAREKTVNEARGEAESRLIDAKAAAEAVKFEAEAEASKLELEATGAARALGILGTALGSQADAAKFQIMREFIAAKRDLARSENAKVIVTSDAPSDILGKAMAFYESSQPSNE